MVESKAGVSDLIPIVFSANALKEIDRLSGKVEKDGKALRVGVKSGGCAGFSYVLEFDTPLEEDRLYRLDNTLNIVIHPSHIKHLQGSEIDFESGLNNRGFIFKNPNAGTTCGCGSSFG